MFKNSTHLAISSIMWFEKVQRSSMCLNYPELVHKHPAHLSFPSKMYLEKVRYSRTTQTHVKELYTPCHISNKGGSRRFDAKKKLHTSALMWVRVGYNALELRRTSALAPCLSCIPFKDVLRIVMDSRTTPNSCERTLHTLLHQQ